MEPLASLRAYVDGQDKLDREAREMFPYEFSECSVAQGYVKQQVFACLTCMKSTGSEHAGGVCYSCSITCHGEHDLVELFNRRAFRCDCGSPLMGDTICNLTKCTRDQNQENQYNENYKNIFCYCRIDYDPVSEDGTMFQCLLCEDWYHDRCITDKEFLPDEDAFEHYVCRICAGNVPWLRAYQIRIHSHDLSTSLKDSVNTLKRKRCSSSDTDVREVSEPFKKSQALSTCATDDEETLDGRLPGTQSEMLGLSCKILPTADQASTSIFLPIDFRDHFCACENCQQRITAFPALSQEEAVYDPPQDEDDNTSSVDAGTRALESTLQAMPREKAIEGLLAYNKLKEHITACLKPLAEKGEIITKQHIKDFFQRPS